MTYFLFKKIKKRLHFLFSVMIVYYACTVRVTVHVMYDMYSMYHTMYEQCMHYQNHGTTFVCAILCTTRSTCVCTFSTSTTVCIASTIVPCTYYTRLYSRA